MKKNLCEGLVVLLVVSVVPSPIHAAAQAFVSVNGHDVGDCSSGHRACRTLSFAIAAVDPAGEVIVLTSGSYGGTSITVTKSVSVDVAPGVVALSNSPIQVLAGPSDTVVLRGLPMNAATPGTGDALDFFAGGALYVENCVIDGWNGSISFFATGSPRVHILNTVVRNNGFGLLLTPGPGRKPQVTVQDSRFENNTNCGVFAASPGNISVSNSVSSGNSAGFCAENGGSMSVQDSIASDNTNFGFGTTPTPTGGVMRVTRCMATGNGAGFSNIGGEFESLGNNLVRGNGTDLVGTITIIPGN
jgi:hypothetical protein